MNTNNEKKLNFDEERTKRMIKRIFLLERDNAKTSRYGDRKMKEAIIKIIEEEI